MSWIDEGYLISKTKYNENSIIAEFFTNFHGKCSGIIFGGSSRKIKNYMQIGNKFHLNCNNKVEGRINTFKVEILKPISPNFFDNKNKLMCISSVMSLVKILTVEAQENKKVYKDIESFLNNLDDIYWLNKYIFWELNLLKHLGYDLDIENIVSFEIINNKKKYFVKSNSTIKYVPNFLVEKNNVTDQKSLILGLKIITDYLNKSVLSINNISHPLARINFINSLD